ncbi:MAG: EscU/YscU/HrcU family type III secretion system export apparatus switch protein, partial [Candidatus Thiodiazotropha taylori]
ARDAHVPILRNVDLARTLYADTKEGDVIPSELFDVMAEVILWATQVKKKIDNDLEDDDKRSKQIKAPGEDLTHYPDEVVI